MGQCRGSELMGAQGFLGGFRGGGGGSYRGSWEFESVYKSPTVL